MKILNLHTCPNGLFSKFKNPNGGLEKVVYDFHILMQEFGVDIISVCSPSDWCVEVSGFIPINPNSSVEWSNNWKPYCNALYTMIERERPDVIIVHGTNKLLKVFNGWNIPVLFIDHQGHGSINLLYHLDFYTKIVPENRSYGGKIFGVSDLSNILKEEEISKQKIDNNFKFDGFLKFQYITEELEKYSTHKHNSKAVTIGNPEGYKQPHKIDFLRKKGFVENYTLITQKPENPKDKIVKYWDRYIASSEEILSRTKCNISRTDTFDILNQSMVYASTSPFESAGITTFESFSMGVPAILWANKEKHASVMFAPEGRGWVWEYITSDSLPDFVGYTTVADRNKIRDYTYEVNKKEIVFNDILDKLEQYIKTSSVKSNFSLEEFF